MKRIVTKTMKVGRYVGTRYVRKLGLKGEFNAGGTAELYDYVISPSRNTLCIPGLFYYKIPGNFVPYAAKTFGEYTFA